MKTQFVDPRPHWEIRPVDNNRLTDCFLMHRGEFSTNAEIEFEKFEKRLAKFPKVRLD